MATSGNDEAFTRIEKFNGQNFHLWKFKIQMILEEKDLWKIVIGDEVEPNGEGTTDTQRRQYQRRERKAFATICLSLGDEQLSLVRSARTAKDAWAKLESHYEVKSLANKLFLRKKYFTTSMGPDDSMTEHLNKMKDIASQLEALGASVSEEDQVATLLCSLPDSYSGLITALESRADDLSLEFVTARLLHEEQKRKESNESKDIGEKALLCQKSKNDKVKNTKFKRKGKCHNCGLPGHWARECRKPKQNQQSDNRNKREEASYGATVQNSSLFTDSKESAWYIDSGASSHMSYNKDIMVDFIPFKFPEKVKLGDDRIVQALGKGNVHIEIKSKKKYEPRRLVDVLYVPDLGKNLFSVSATAKRGYSVEFNQHTCLILDQNGTISGSGRMMNNLYVLDVKEEQDDSKHANVSTSDTSEEIWHQRYGHLSLKNLRLLRDQKLVKGLNFQSDDHFEVCEGCAQGKQIRATFPREPATRAKDVLDLVHSDVCGPMEETSLGGNKYFITFIDDKSRYTTVYFMKSKDEAFEKFKEFEAMVTNLTNKKIKVLRSDNGGEYTCHMFEKYLKDKGIQHQFSVPRTPQQNGVSERMNRTIQEAARSMLNNAKLPKKFWAEAVHTAVILRNRSPTVSVNGVTPYECFHSKKPDVSHLRIFGCTAYMHVPKETRKKWDSKTKKCTFVGYSLTSKGYRLYDASTGKIHISRDVLFDESSFDRRKKSTIVIHGYDKDTVTEKQNDELLEDNEEHEVKEEMEDNSNNSMTDEQQQPRRSARIHKSPDRHGVVIIGNWWQNNVASIDDESIRHDEPLNINEAFDSPDKAKWKQAMDNEYSSHIKKQYLDIG